MRPPASVLTAWALPADALRLEGGQGTSLLVGDLVLKPDADEQLCRWLAGLHARLAGSPGFRLAAPVPTTDGRLVVDGWSATAYVQAAPVPDDDTSARSWLPVLDAARAFHRSVVDERPPAFLAARADRWARADRAAWGEGGAREVGERSAPLLAHAEELVVDEGLRAQLVHGDLSGNVLLAEGEPPLVIDVSPYWRPAAYADAVVVIDALLWWRSDSALLALGRPVGLPTRAWRSLLARALVFRLLAFDEPHRDRDDVVDQLPRYAEVLGLLDDLG